MTDAEFELELVEALNMLLEDERASVEMEVALASGATEYGERDTLTAMGAEDIHFCVQLREEMEDAGLPVTPQINGVVFEVIGAERYDDRLRAFAHHQRVVADRARELQESNLEGALRAALDGISMSHDLHADWIERRAAEFAATRTLEFGVGARASAATGQAAPEPAEPVEPIEQAERIAPAEVVEPAEPAISEQPGAEAAPLTTTPAEVPVVEPEPSPEPSPEPAPEESTAPAEAPKPRTRTASRSATAGSAKPSATRAKTPRTTKTTTRKAATTTPKTPTRRTRRAPDAETPSDEA